MDPDIALRALGVFVQRDALATTSCAELVRLARGLSWEDAVVIDDGAPDGAVKPALRRTRRSGLPNQVVPVVDGLLARAKPDLERHFGVELQRYEPPQLLRYVAGDHFGVHTDRSDRYERGSERKVSISLLLNSPTLEPGYAGGELAFFGLFEAPDATEVGVPVAAEAGMLVAFTSDTAHAVSPVTAGERFAVVTWWS